MDDNFSAPFHRSILSGACNPSPSASPSPAKTKPKAQAAASPPHSETTREYHTGLSLSPSAPFSPTVSTSSQELLESPPPAAGAESAVASATTSASTPTPPLDRDLIFSSDWSPLVNKILSYSQSESLTKLKKSLQCPVCGMVPTTRSDNKLLKLKYNPPSTLRSCRHSFCYSCLRSHFQKFWNCPFPSGCTIPPLAGATSSSDSTMKLREESSSDDEDTNKSTATATLSMGGFGGTILKNDPILAGVIDNYTSMLSAIRDAEEGWWRVDGSQEEDG